jgi:dTDP-4-dehydrorhamnose 3,5-epimerase
MEDERGCFMEAYRRSVFREFGIEEEFVQDNLSISKKGVLRGLHFQIAPHEQGKLVRVLSGEVFDVAVDLRLDSPSFGRWAAVTLSAKEGLAFYIPRGFAHGFMVLSEEATFLYKCTSEYAPERESGLRWDDPDVAIEWPLRPRLVSAKDTSLPRLSELGLGTMNR